MTFHNAMPNTEKQKRIFQPKAAQFLQSGEVLRNWTKSTRLSITGNTVSNLNCLQTADPTAAFCEFQLRKEELNVRAIEAGTRKTESENLAQLLQQHSLLTSNVNIITPRAQRIFDGKSDSNVEKWFDDLVLIAEDYQWSEQQKV